MGVIHNSNKLTALGRRRLSQGLARCPDLRLYRRIHALWLLAKGYGLDQVVAMSQCSRRSLYYWLKRYHRVGRCSALKDAPRSGRPRQAPKLTGSRILAELRHKPWRLGYNTTVWTVALLARQLGQRYGCVISPGTLRRRLHQARLRWKRPRHSYTVKDPHRT